MARRLEVKGRVRGRRWPYTSVADFSFGKEATEFDFAEAWKGSLEERAYLTPYAYDQAHDEILFVQTAPDCDLLHEEPFFFEAQYKNAHAAISVPLKVCHEVAAKLASSMPTPPPCFFLYSTGRCGSTLVSKAIDKSDTAQSLSEPDLYHQLMRLYKQKHLSHQELLRLIASTTHYFCSFMQHANPEKPVVVLKVQPMVIMIAKEIQEALPTQAHQLFLYRGARPTIKSHMGMFMTSWQFRVVKYLGLDPWFAKSQNETEMLMPLCKEEAFKGCPVRNRVVARQAMLWISILDQAQRLSSSQSEPFFTWIARYENLADTKVQVPLLTKLMNLMGLEVHDVDALRQVLGRDSQEGSQVASVGTKMKNIFSQKDEDVMSEILNRHLPLGAPDFEMPGTIAS